VFALAIFVDGEAVRTGPQKTKKIRHFYSLHAS
jgi:hypothetical protein